MQAIGPSLGTIIVRGIGRGFSTLWRERDGISGIVALVGVFFLGQLLLLLMLGMQGSQNLLRARTDLRLEILETANNQDIREFLSALQQQPFIGSVLYVTREQAYERARTRDPELVAFLEQFGLENPFPETIGVTLRSLEDYDAFAAFVESDTWTRVIDPAFLSQITDQEEQVYELLRVTETARAITAVILIVTAITVICIAMELTRRRALARADEVMVERLVGAHVLSITLPFAVESVMLFVASIALSAGLAMALIWSMPSLLPDMASEGILQALSAEFIPLLHTQGPLILGGELLAGPLLAIVGTWLGIRPHLRSTSLALS